MPGTLYIVATPIGNLKDVSERALETLKEVDYILAEDTRVTVKLLNHYGIKKKLYSYSEHSSATKEETVIQELNQGKNYALVSDAGTPAISDPGARLVGKVLQENLSVIPIPGPSSVTSLMSVFGVPESSFHFWGFFPIKNKKKKQLIEYINEIPGVHVFFESPYRIIKTLEQHFVERDEFYMVIGREMTKQFETFYRGKPRQVLEALQQDKIKGEFCVGVIKNGI